MSFGRWTVDRDLERPIRATPVGITDGELERRLEDDEACCVCYTILLTAVSMECAHSICASCAAWLPINRCPLCRTDFDNVEVDEETRQRVGEVPAKCSPCGFRGTVREVLQHKKADCTGQTVYCRREGCPDTLERRLLAQHEEVCGYKKVTCLCSYRTLKKDLDRHRETDCATHPVPCPVPGCGRQLERAKVAIHVTQECQYTVICCHVPGCGFVGRAPDMAGHAANFSAQHAALLTHHNDRWKIRLAEGRLKPSDASLEYGEVRAMTFTIPNIKTNLTDGTTAFTSPSCRGIYNAEWKVSLEKEDRWYIYLCLVSRARPLHLKVVFLLQAPNCGEDHAISLGGTLEVRENRKYGAPVPRAKLEDLSDSRDRLVVKVMMQQVSASINM
ncbi:PREDICTED: TNF receptor-associated factor 3-like isoform X2 [Branchiostoma belcheri]|uniref:TNF receptor-associated factor 3-like isoform X2 n=1 Tax=Branchiostoma belcheri TaxID=7741 RepID=A0A6P4YSR2_BRABE|nr:PREDICTED: TNF receptor-associated factor 3-like isoform X2 [Branchiostoma belcheri]